MKRTVDMPKIEINGQIFEIKMSDGDVYAAGRRVVAECAALKITDENAVGTVIRRICDTVDDALGRGAMARIAKGKPVTLPFALKVFNEVVGACAARYTAYIQRDYLGGGGAE